MSLDIASHPGRTGTDELVPSRYALRIGEIDVLVISDGVFPLPAATLATNALAAWLDDRLRPPDVYKWPLNVVVVRGGGRTVLIDGHRRRGCLSRGVFVRTKLSSETTLAEGDGGGEVLGVPRA